VRAEVPGFAANEINVSVELLRLVISGKSEKTTEDQKEQTLLSEFRSNQFCRELRLPAEVDPAKTTAVLKDGVLELGFTKVAESKAVNVEVKPEYWNIPHRLRKNPNHVGENSHFNALLRWRLNISLMAKQLLSKSRSLCRAKILAWQREAWL